MHLYVAVSVVHELTKLGGGGHARWRLQKKKGGFFKQCISTHRFDYVQQIEVNLSFTVCTLSEDPKSLTILVFKGKKMSSF